MDKADNYYLAFACELRERRIPDILILLYFVIKSNILISVMHTREAHRIYDGSGQTKSDNL